MKQEKSCGAFVFRKEKDDIEVLIIHQVQGHWCFPKGHVEKNETEEETAIREIREETGLKVSILEGFREVIDYCPKENVHKDVVYFIAKPLKGHIKVQEEELAEAYFMSFDEARKLITYDNDRELFEKAAAFISAHKEMIG